MDGLWPFLERLLVGLDWLAGQLGVAVGTPEYYALAGAVLAPPGILVLRSGVTILARMLGLSHPDNYRLWPRLPWRSLVRAWLAVRRWHERVFVFGQRATGGFAGLLGTLSTLYRPGHVLLGRVYGLGFGWLQPVGLKVTRHLFMYAMTGAGKTTALMSIVAAWRGSAFIVDPKGQITRGLRARDRRRWAVIDPYHIAGLGSAEFNIFDVIKEAMAREGDQAAVLWATRVAEALVITPPGSRSPFFTDTARGFVAGLILYVLVAHPEEDHHLPCVRDLIVSGYQLVSADGVETTVDEAHALLLRMMQRSPDFDGTIAGAAAMMVSVSGETGGNVRATLQEQTKWLDIPAVRAVLRRSSIRLSDLKTRADWVLSFTAPVFSIRQELAPMSRLLTNLLAYTFEAVPQKNGQCLTVIDELPSQGHNATLEVMLAVARSYGITFLGIAQNEELMRKHYPDSWGTFTGEADAVYWMATNHDQTAAHLSKILGKKALIEKDRYSGRKSVREVEVMDPEQVKRYLDPGSGRLIVTRAGARALKLVNEPYYKALPVWCYAPDPDHREALARRMTRVLFDRKGRRAEAALRVAQPSPVSTPALTAPSNPQAAAMPSASNVLIFPNSQEMNDDT